MRIVVSALLASLALLGLPACGGDDEAEPSGPTDLTSFVLVEADAPGSKPDPVETQESTEDLAEFATAVSEAGAGTATDEIESVFDEAGFLAAITDTRFLGETHSKDAPHVASSVIQLDSEEGTQSALEWLHQDALAPCPETCAVQSASFDVDGIDGAVGAHRSASAEDIERLGQPGETPFDIYLIYFAVGPLVYGVRLNGPAGTVTQEQAVEIAKTYRERVADLPPPEAPTS